MATQPIGIRGVGGSDDSLATFAPPPAAALKVSGVVGCVTIGPLAVLPAACVPTACSLLSKNF